MKSAPDATGAAPRRRRAAAIALAVPLMLATGLSGCQDNATAIVRGDRLWADSNFTGALAEYQLAAAQRGDEEALSRLAHAYAMTGDVGEARGAYGRLIERSADYEEQAVFDYLSMARRGLRRGDVFTVASALDAALELRPGLTPDGSTQVARFYAERDEPDRALVYYHRAMARLPADSTPPLVYEMGRLNQELGECEVATDYYRAFRGQAAGVRAWRSLVSEAEWHTGSCAFELALEARDEGHVDAALDHLDRLIRLGVPENLLDQAWLERAELLFALAEYDEALAAYRQVLQRNPTRTGPLVERAQRRIDEIRFGDLPTDTAATIPPRTD